MEESVFDEVGVETVDPDVEENVWGFLGVDEVVAEKPVSEKTTSALREKPELKTVYVR